MKKNKLVSNVMVEVEKPKMIHFPQGMVGFPDAKKYVMLKAGHGDIACMQCTEHPEAAFLVTPWDRQRLGLEPVLTPEQQECLRYADNHHIQWLLVLNPFSDPEWVLANMRAPVAINVNTSSGMQCIQKDPQLNLRFHWMRQPSQAQRAA